MKVSIEVAEHLEQDEVVIRCKKIDDTVQQLYRSIVEKQAATPNIVFYKNETEYYFPLADVLFFETQSEQVFAHTKLDSFRIKHKLYELESILSRNFVRVAKSTIVNTNQIFALTRDLTSSSLIQFNNTHKKVYASRHYYRALRERLGERSNHEG